MDFFDGCLITAILSDFGFLSAKLISFEPISKVPIEDLTTLMDFWYALIAAFSFVLACYINRKTSKLRHPQSYRLCFFTLLVYLIAMQYIHDSSIAASLTSSITFYFLSNELIRHFIFWLDDIRHPDKTLPDKEEKI
jgi:hypothetical protein